MTQKERDELVKNYAQYYVDDSSDYELCDIIFYQLTTDELRRLAFNTLVDKYKNESDKTLISNIKAECPFLLSNDTQVSN